MKTKCSKKDITKFFYKLMNSEEEKSFKEHIKECDICKYHLKMLTNLKKITDKRKDKLPDFNPVQFPEISQRDSLFKKPLPSFFRVKALRYGFALSLIFLVVLSITIFIKKEDVAEKEQPVAVEKEYKEAKTVISKLKRHKNPAVDAANKEAKWCFAAEGALRSQPVIKNGYLYFGSDDKRIYSINSKTGKLIWSYRTKGAINSAPVIHDDYIYIASTDKNLYKFHCKSGKLIWKKEIGKLVLSRFYIDESGIYIANSTGKIIALSLDGGELWNKEMNLEVYSSIAGDKGNIYFGTVKGVVYSLVKSDGNIAWQQATGSRFLSARPLVAEGQLIIGDVDGVLHSFNKSDGQPGWQYKTEYQISTDPIYKNKKIYFASDKLYCLDMKGKEQWTFATSSPVDTNPGICENIITLADNNNNVYSINAQNGYCLKKDNSEEMILSFVFACNEIYTGNRKGEICVLK